MTDNIGIKTDRLVLTHPILGSHVVTGVSDGDAFDFSFDNPDIEESQGGDGLTVIAETGKDTGTGIINLQPTSSTNTFLRRVRNLALLQPGTGVMSLRYTSPARNLIISSNHVEIMQGSGLTAGNTVNEISWSFKLAPMNEKNINDLL